MGQTVTLIIIIGVLLTLIYYSLKECGETGSELNAMTRYKKTAELEKEIHERKNTKLKNTK